ncbi:MAG: YdgA family protein [Succinivibrio sp.]|nr:YdgA family protein [Succinivibrio sp.]
MHKCIKVAGFTLGGLMVLGVAGLFAGSMLIDSAVDKALLKASSKVSGLKLDNKFTSSSPLSREGVLMWNYTPKHQIMGLDYLEGAVKYRVDLGLFKVSGVFEQETEYGNLASLMTKVGLPLLHYHGDFEASLWKLSLQGKLKTDALQLPVADGSCSLSEQHFSFSTMTFKSFRTSFDSDGITCQSDLLYNGRPAYVLKASGLKVKANPTLVNHKPQLEEVQLQLDTLEGDASSLYLIGFTPEDKVRDPSMREGFKFSNLGFELGLSDKDRMHRQSLNFKGQGDLLFGFPMVKENQQQPWFDMQGTRLDFALHKLDLMSLPKLASADKESLPRLLGAVLSDPLSFKLDTFTFKHAGESMLTEGEGRFSLDQSELKPRNLYLDFKVALGQKLVDTLFEQQYREALQEASQSGAVRFDGRQYSTRFVLKDNQMSLNGQPLGSAQ